VHHGGHHRAQLHGLAAALGPSTTSGRSNQTWFLDKERPNLRESVARVKTSMQPRKIRLGYDKISEKLVAPIQRPLLAVTVAHDEEISPRASVRERSPAIVIGLPLLAAERAWVASPASLAGLP